MTVQSLYVGLTGLTAMGHNIDVIGNNIANVNTTGFRASRAAFDDIFYQTMFHGAGASGERGGINPKQVGTGVKLSSIDTIFTQGQTQNTGRLLDLSIDGKGFFTVQGRNDQTLLTRAGNFSLDENGSVVDPGTGYNLQGWMADDEGNLANDGNPENLVIDYGRISKAKQTTNVTAGGNFDAGIGEPNSGSSVSPALKTTKVQGLFDGGGNPFGLVNGDVLRIESGLMNLENSSEDSIDLSQLETSNGNPGAIMTITESTTIEDIQNSIQSYLDQAAKSQNGKQDSDIYVSYDNESGSFTFNNQGGNAIQGVRFGVAPREGQADPPEQANRMVGNLFVNQDDPDFSKTLNVGAEESVSTHALRRADASSTIDVFDSQGLSHAVTVGLTANTEKPSADTDTAIGKLKDSEGRFLIPDGIVPPKIEYSDPVIDSSTNTAVFTASQVNNLLATQGVFSFQDGEGNLIGLRLSDGAISFNGARFENPEGANSNVFDNADMNVAGANFLNTPGSGRVGGLMGDEGFSEDTELQDIIDSIQDRINNSISQVAGNLGNLDPGAMGSIELGGATAFTSPGEIPEIRVELSEDGSLKFSSKGGSLGAADTTDEDIASQLAESAGGEDKLGLQLDLAAKTRSVRVSTSDQQIVDGETELFPDNKVDEETDDGGPATGFVKNRDPFAEDLLGGDSPAFVVGNTDYDVTTDVEGDPTESPPSGVDDSGVHLIALSSGRFGDSEALTDQNFNEVQAFTPRDTAFQALFNQRGYGVAQDFDGDGVLDRASGASIGIVAENNNAAFETNTLHTERQTQNTVNYQVVTNSDNRTPPQGITGSLIFDSQGNFLEYGEGVTPNIIFDPDNNDKQGDGADAIHFDLDMNNITYNSGSNTAELKSQDGRTMGNLDDVSVDRDGQIIGAFTNGDVQSLGKVAVADVINEGGLIQEGDTYFSVGPNAGDLHYLEAGVNGGSINSGVLELSNVDLANEFTNLIVAQRAYQANTRIITTGDQILTETVNIKR